MKYVTLQKNIYYEPQWMLDFLRIAFEQYWRFQTFQRLRFIQRLPDKLGSTSTAWDDEIIWVTVAAPMDLLLMLLSLVGIAIFVAIIVSITNLIQNRDEGF